MAPAMAGKAICPEKRKQKIKTKERNYENSLFARSSLQLTEQTMARKVTVGLSIGGALGVAENMFDPERYSHREAAVDCLDREALGFHRGAFADVFIFDIPTPGQVENGFFETLETWVSEDVERMWEDVDKVLQLYSEDVEDLTAEGVAWVDKTYGHVWYERPTKLEQWARREESNEEVLPCTHIGSRLATTLEFGDAWPCWGSLNGENGQNQSWKVATTGQKARHQWARHERQFVEPWRERDSDPVGEILAQELAEFFDEYDRGYCIAFSDLDLVEFGVPMKDATAEFLAAA